MSGKSPLGAINTHRNHTRHGNYDGALVAAKTRATLGCGGPGMAPRYYYSWYWDIYWRLTPFTRGS